MFPLAPPLERFLGNKINYFFGDQSLSVYYYYVQSYVFFYLHISSKESIAEHLGFANGIVQG